MPWVFEEIADLLDIQGANPFRIRAYRTAARTIRDLGSPLAQMPSKARVREYLAILIFEQEIRWHALAEEKYRLLSPDTAGVWRSQVFPGLWLDGPALLAGDVPRVLSRLDEGLACAEHKKFVEELTRRRAGVR